MRFSVLISVYHKEDGRYLAESLKSLVDQTLVPDEIVLVKDGLLTDELNRVIDNFKENYDNILKIVNIEHNVGLGKALSIGLQYCTYNVVARMDSDDICYPDRFAKQMKFIKENPDVDIAGAWISEFENDPEDIVSVRKVPTHFDEIYEYAKFRCPINHPSVVFKKESVLKAGNYTDFAPIEDYYIWFRMLMSGARFANIPESLVLVRIGNRMISRRSGIRYLKKEIELFNIMRKEKYINSFEFTRNVISRLLSRLLPASLLHYVYSNFARK